MLDTTLTTPARSLLSPLDPQFQDDIGKECFSSYLCRFARYNDIRPVTLISLIGKELPGDALNFFGYFTRKLEMQLRLSFDSKLVCKLTKGISKITNCSDVSEFYFYTIHEGNGIGSHYKGVERMRWCQLCLEEMAIPFIPERWLRSETGTCAIHNVNLESRCSVCGKIPNIFKNSAVVGFCDYCGTPLTKRIYKDYQTNMLIKAEQ